MDILFIFLLDYLNGDESSELPFLTNGIHIYGMLENEGDSYISWYLLASLREHFSHLIKIILYALFSLCFSFANIIYFLIDAFYGFMLLLFLVFYFFRFINKILLFLFMFPFLKFLLLYPFVIELKYEEFLFLKYHLLHPNYIYNVYRNYL